MNETEKAVAAKLLTQIVEAPQNMQHLEIEKYHSFMRAVECRQNVERPRERFLGSATLRSTDEKAA